MDVSLLNGGGNIDLCATVADQLAESGLRKTGATVDNDGGINGIL